MTENMMSTNYHNDDWRSEFEIWWDSMPSAPDVKRSDLHNMKMAAMASWKEVLERVKRKEIKIWP